MHAGGCMILHEGLLIQYKVQTRVLSTENESIGARRGYFLLSERLIRVIPDVLGAVGEPHSVMPVARTAAAATAVAVTVEVMVTYVPAATADPEGRLLGLVAPSEI